MRKLRIMECFGGIGACSKALERLGIDFEIVDYVEIDKYAVASFNAIHGTNFEPQDICTWDKDIDVDLIMHGSPCQDFSIAGKQAGGDKGSDTRSSLMYETIRIVEKLKPKYIIWENVKNMLSKNHVHNFYNYLDKMTELGYRNYFEVLNAKDYGIPQNRERVFTISIRNDIENNFYFPKKKKLDITLKDMLEDNVDEKYYLSDKMIKYVCSRMPSGEHHITTGIHMTNKNEDNSVAGTICTEPGNKPSDNFIIDNENVVYSKEKGALEIQSVYGEKEIQLFTEDGNIRRYINSDIVDEFKEGQMATTTFPNGYGHGPRTHNESISLNTVDRPSVKQNLRIRKLTPCECWVLMGFSKEDYMKAEEVNSNAQLYKQAGNSIVVNVLMEILNILLRN